MALTSTGQIVAVGQNDKGQLDLPAPPEGRVYTAIAAPHGRDPQSDLGGPRYRGARIARGTRPATGIGGLMHTS
ncbi:hypothetical protein [Rhodococcus sp. AG1013]|uniref:hypothetical protein n=1 Tax=unclassified Rhodococcus (in: high G+C Gram-positive bacteria) TaxID=192944 RepID=UPI0037C5BAA3